MTIGRPRVFNRRKQTTLYFEHTDWLALAREAERQGTNISALIRDWTLARLKETTHAH